MEHQKEPVFGDNFGDSGMGKTVDAVYAFPDGVFLAGPGALKSAESVCGIKPFVKVIDTLEDAIEFLRAVKAKSKKRPIAYILDDVSLLQQRSIMVSKKDNYGLWRDVLDKILEIAHMARYELDAHFWMTAHEQAPKEVRGRWVPGGPLLQGMAAAHLPKQMDVQLRVQRDEKRPIWPFVYQCNNVDPDFITKDRNNVCADLAPMNLGEILRASGYTMPRAKGLEWQEEVAARISDKLLVMGEAGMTDSPERKAFLKSVFDFVQKKYSTDLRHVQWAIRDGLDRPIIINSRMNRLKSLLS